MSSHPDDPAIDPHIAAALAQAERRRVMLVELGQIGMNLARGVGAHAAAAMAAINEPKGGDPTRAFATVSRSVRLTLAMEARVDSMILALRKGRMPAGWATGSPAAPREGRFCEKARRREAEESLRSERENLTDRDPVEDFEFGAFGETVAAIRADLGLGPNCCSDDDGVARREVANSSLPFMGRVETKRSEVRGGGVRVTPETLVLTQTSPPTIQTSPLRSALPSRPSP